MMHSYRPVEYNGDNELQRDLVSYITQTTDSETFSSLAKWHGTGKGATLKDVEAIMAGSPMVRYNEMLNAFQIYNASKDSDRVIDIPVGDRLRNVTGVVDYGVLASIKYDSDGASGSVYDSLPEADRREVDKVIDASLSGAGYGGAVPIDCSELAAIINTLYTSMVKHSADADYPKEKARYVINYLNESLFDAINAFIVAESHRSTRQGDEGFSIDLSDIAGDLGQPE